MVMSINPGYAGRTELPSELTAVIQQVNVTVPDKQVLARTMFAINGFVGSVELSKTLAQLLI